MIDMRGQAHVQPAALEGVICFDQMGNAYSFIHPFVYQFIYPCMRAFIHIHVFFL